MAKLVKKVDDSKGKTVKVVAKKSTSMTMKPIQLKEVTVKGVRDSVDVGRGKFTKMDVRDLKGMVKKKNMTSIDTSSLSAMRRTSLGSLDKKDAADSYLANKKRASK